MGKKFEKPEPEKCWMAWSPSSNFLPQAASVDREVCKEMIRGRGFSDQVKPVRVQITPVRRAASQ